MVIKKDIVWSGHTLHLESGKLANRSNGSVLIKYCNTTILCVVNYKKIEKQCDFLPLSVSYQERYSAVGRIPGNFFKREGRSSERETLISRMIDRSLRTMLESYLPYEIQVTCELFSYGNKGDCASLSTIGSAAALMISGLPVKHPICAVSIGIDKENNFENYRSPNFELFAAYNRNSVLSIDMSSKNAKSEDFIKAIKYGEEQANILIPFIEDFAKESNTSNLVCDIDDFYKVMIKTLFKSDLQLDFEDAALLEINKIWKKPSKAKPETLSSVILSKMIKVFDYIKKNNLGDDELLIFKMIRKNIYESMRGEIKGNHFYKMALKHTIKNAINELCFKLNKRIDGRDFSKIREITCDTDILPEPVHGSAVFSRGDTQVISSVTIGMPEEGRLVDDITNEYKESFILHYNFPPYCVGDADKSSNTTRREIGHGHLAWKALKPLMPNFSDFPYTTRVLSDVLSSNGSSSMATICSAYLAMRSAGIELKSKISAIAMGLLEYKNKSKIITDLNGTEDEYGYMDFKIAADPESKTIYAIQMDVKNNGVTASMLKKILSQSFEAIDNVNLKMVFEKESSFSESLLFTRVHLTKDELRNVVGQNAKNMRRIGSKSGTKLSIDGDCIIVSGSADKRRIAIDMIYESLK